MQYKIFFAVVSLSLLFASNTYSQDLISFQDSSGKYGYRNSSGKIVIQAKFEWASYEFSEGRAVVKLNNLYGHINTAGKTIGKIEYENTSAFGNGLCAVCKNKKWGYIDTTGKIIINYQFDFAGRFSENLAAVRLNMNDKYGFIDKTGKVVIAYQFDDIRWFSEGLAPFKMNALWGFIDKTGNKVIENRYINTGGFSEGLCNVQQGTKWGYINKLGVLIIPPKYDYAGSFLENLAAVKLANKWGYINKSGDQIVDFIFDYADAFKGKKAKVKLLNNTFFIDRSGKEIKDKLIKPLDISFLNNMAMSIRDNTFGLLLTNARILMKIENFTVKTTKNMNSYSPDEKRQGEECKEYKSGVKDDNGFDVRLYHFKGSCQFEMTLNKSELLLLTNLLKHSEWKNIQTENRWQIWENNNVLIKFPMPVSDAELFLGADFTMYKKPKK